jgi:hypothetical protein
VILAKLVRLLPRFAKLQTQNSTGIIVANDLMKNSAGGPSADSALLEKFYVGVSE